MRRKPTHKRDKEKTEKEVNNTQQSGKIQHNYR